MATTFTLEIYWAKWSGPSLWVKEQLENNLSLLNKAGCELTCIDVDETPGQTWQTRIFTVPTVVLFKTGEEQWRKSGLLSIDVVLDKIKLHKALET